MQKVFVYPCSTAIGIEVGKALKDNKNFWVEGGTTDPYFKSSDFRSIEVTGASAYDNPDYLVEYLKDKHYKGFQLFTTHDQVTWLMSQAPGWITSSSNSTVDICRFKSKTYKALKGIVNVPEFFPWDTCTTPYKCFVKPDAGQGSRGAKVLTDYKEMIQQSLDPTMIVMEYLEGEEYTVDCFSDETGLRYISCRKRLATANGISVSTYALDYAPLYEKLKEMAHLISNKLGMENAWFFQVKLMDTGKIVLLEVAPRISGNSAYSRYDGVNLVELSILNFLRKPGDPPLTINPNKQVSYMRKELRDVVQMRIRLKDYNTVYIDLDDTLLLDCVMNSKLVAFIVACRNIGMNAVLMTRNQGPVLAALNTWGIAGLFEEIIKVKANEKKSSYVTTSKSLAIDDSFREREDFKTVCDGGAYGLDQLDVLMENLPNA